MGSLKLDETCMQLNFELQENLSRKSNFPEVWKTKNKHNKRRRVRQCSVEARGGKDPTVGLTCSRSVS